MNIPASEIHFRKNGNVREVRHYGLAPGSKSDVIIISFRPWGNKRFPSFSNDPDNVPDATRPYDSNHVASEIEDISNLGTRHYL